MRTFAESPGCVQAKMTSSPTRTMRGNPLARAAAELATTTAGGTSPLGPMRFNRTSAPSSPTRSSQVTSACPVPSSSTSTRPAGVPSSTRIGAPNVAPASLENATFTFAGRNLAIWTSYKGPDPEANYSQSDVQQTYSTSGQRTYFTLRLALHY